MLMLSGLVILVLVVATTVMQFPGSSSELENNKQRLYSWWVIWAVCIGVVFIGKGAVVVFVYILIICSAIELMFLLSNKINLLSIIILVSAVALIDLALMANHIVLVVFVAVLCGVVILLLPLTSLWREAVVITYCVSGLKSLQVIVGMQISNQDSVGLMLLMLFVLTGFNDVVQYIFGKRFGKTPLALVLSPNKTIEGAIGGVLCSSVLGAILAVLVLKVSWHIGLLMGMVIALAGIAGDLSISILKRLAGVKHTGRIIPGHGGLLDRIDSLLLSAPVFAMFLYVLQKGA